jgi:hypothetical protein
VRGWWEKTPFFCLKHESCGKSVFIPEQRGGIFDR